MRNQQDFEQIILRSEEDGELIVQYGLNQDLAGFSRIFRQEVAVEKKHVTTYSALIYLNPQYRACPTVANTGLSEAIKYKLAHPQEELIYVAFADNPLTYEFIYQLSDSIYPKPSQRVPDQIITVINALKKQNGWISTNNHPMVVNSILVPVRNQTMDLHENESELNEFYLSANPDYIQGNALLVYMPLHLANISYGLNHQNSSCFDKPEHSQNQGYQDGDPSELQV